MEKVIQEEVGKTMVRSEQTGNLTPFHGLPEPIFLFLSSRLNIFFNLAFPCLFLYGSGDFHINRCRTCDSMSDLAEQLMWFIDGRFAQHQYFKFILHNIIMR